MTRPMSLRGQLLALQVAVVLVVVLGSGLVALALQERAVREASRSTMVAVAQSVAQLPAVVEAFDDAEPALAIQPIAEVIREGSGVTYVVVTDDQGIRYSHPDPARIGERVSTDPSVPLAGGVYVGTQTGTLGESWRVKVPVLSEPDGPGGERRVIGSVSVGVLESELRAALLDDLGGLVAWLAVAAGAGVVAAAGVTALVRRRTFSLEPEQIAALLETSEAMLHGIHEGFVAVDARGRVAVVNDEARRLLRLPAAGGGDDPVGRPADQVLEPRLLATGDGEHLVLAGERVLLAARSSAQVAGRPVATLLLLRDRTELTAALRDLDGARELTAALRAQAHEFANHLHVVSGLLELGRSDDAVRFVQRVGGGGPLAPGRSPAGIDDPAVAALLLAKVGAAHARGVAVVVEPSSTLGALDAAASEDLVTVLGNLVDNAVDAVGAVVGPGGGLGGGGRVEVLVRGDAGAGVEVVVGDDGPGVPPAQRQRVFEVGCSTKGAGAPGTRGFGLALVARVAARRGGQAHVGTSPTGGAQVRVLLPAVSTAVDVLDAAAGRVGAGRS